MPVIDHAFEFHDATAGRLEVLSGIQQLALGRAKRLAGQGAGWGARALDLTPFGI
ncbi:MAG: hypothetical protein ABJC79_00320 [Acidimicrobiia bacterium]